MTTNRFNVYKAGKTLAIAGLSAAAFGALNDKASVDAAAATTEATSDASATKADSSVKLVAFDANTGNDATGAAYPASNETNGSSTSGSLIEWNIGDVETASAAVLDNDEVNTALASLKDATDKDQVNNLGKTLSQYNLSTNNNALVSTSTGNKIQIVTEQYRGADFNWLGAAGSIAYIAVPADLAGKVTADNPAHITVHIDNITDVKLLQTIAGLFGQDAADALKNHSTATQIELNPSEIIYDTTGQEFVKVDLGYNLNINRVMTYDDGEGWGSIPYVGGVAEAIAWLLGQVNLLPDIETNMTTTLNIPLTVDGPGYATTETFGTAILPQNYWSLTKVQSKDFTDSATIKFTDPAQTPEQGKMKVIFNVYNLAGQVAYTTTLELNRGESLNVASTAAQYLVALGLNPSEYNLENVTRS
jgi:hypothetical protein